MGELRRETFPEGRFTLVFMGYEGSAGSQVELTYNWDQQTYSHGTGYGHIALEVADIDKSCAHMASKGAKILRPPGPMKLAPTETGVREIVAFIQDPDGYRIELIQA